MVLKLVPSLALANNKFPWEAKRHPLFVLFSSLQYIPSIFLNILANPKNAHLWISSTGMHTSVVLRLSFSLSDIDPNAPDTTGMAFVFTSHIFPISLARSLYFSTFSSFFIHLTIIRKLLLLLLLLLLLFVILSKLLLLLFTLSLIFCFYVVYTVIIIVVAFLNLLLPNWLYSLNSEQIWVNFFFFKYWNIL